MTLIEDDSLLRPDIEADVQMYIDGLDEGHQNYTRFFDALLVKRTQHRSFYRDLKAFRSQPRVIRLLEQAITNRETYREVTVVFLESRFAHPWCRRTPMKKAFWRAEWGSIEGNPRDTEVEREEQRLHKLLVPIWIIMRSRMFPGEETVTQWCQAEKERRSEQQSRTLTAAALQQHNSDLSKQPMVRNVERRQSEGQEAESEREAAAAVASSVFRLAAAGMIISQTPKRKLRWLTKKPL